MRPSLLAAAATALVFGSAVCAQGDFVNYETPQVKPIAIATIQGKDWLLVCNTPDNSVEVYDGSFPYSRIKRVPVGLGPVSVRWHAGFKSFYTCNFDGDSVTKVRLDAVGASIKPVIELTTFVGDEPSDITFTTDGKTAFVTLNSRKAITQRVAADMTMVVSEAVLSIPNSNPIADYAVKQPRMMETLADGRVLVANFMGDTPLNAPWAYDLDFYYYNPAAAPNTLQQITGLGTTNHAFAVQADGKRMFAVGTLAQHNLPLNGSVGVAKVSQLKTGFVQSWMWVVDIPPGQAAMPQPEAPAAILPAPTFRSVNLNRNYAAATLSEVGPARALAQPTDIALWQPQSTTDPEKVFVAAYHSDKVAALSPNVNTQGGWNVTPIGMHTPTAPYSAVGPRGLAVSYTATDPDADGARPGLVYVANRLDNTVSIIDPIGERRIRTFNLNHDPTPDVIKAGRKFLYSAEFSGNKMVSCASCHVDGRNDGLAWNLGNNDPTQPPVHPWLNDGTGMTFSNFPPDKGPVMTQTLQGLVNHPVNVEMQALFSNAPYHWRGDKQTINEFNEAFVNLQGMTNIGSKTDPMGLVVGEMQAYANFVNTIRHPPNYEEPIDRIPTGALDATNPQDPDSAQASGARLGQLIYHNKQFADAKTCVQCHNLPDGSSNTFSLQFPIPRTLGTGTVNHPMESAATRNLLSREMTLHGDLTNNISYLIGNRGLLHPGDPFFGGFGATSINGFIWTTFRLSMPGLTAALRDKQTAAVTEFVRQMDTGIAPAAGFAFTLVPTGTALNTAIFDLLENQVLEANVGLAVYTRKSGIERGYWFDATATAAKKYREEGQTSFVDRTDLQRIAATAGDVVILQATPVGSQRRVANLAGRATGLSGPAPANITIEAMAPARHWLDITQFTGNINHAPNFSLRTRDEFWKAITANATQANFGIPKDRRHEPPRRFRVSGDNIRPGSWLFLGMAGHASPRPIPKNNPQFIAMPLFPTRYTSSGRQVWETTVECAPIITLGLLNGGAWADGVAPVAQGNYSPVPGLNPQTWNFYTAVVFNEDLTSAATAQWQPLGVQDTR